MNADPWVHPNSIYAETQMRELRAREKWSQTHGTHFNYSMSKPPKHRQCSYQSWMAEAPDDFVLEMLRYEHNKAKHHFGSPKQRKQPLDIPKQMQPPRRIEYKSELESTRVSLVEALAQVEEGLKQTQGPTRPASAASSRRRASSGASSGSAARERRPASAGVRSSTTASMPGSTGSSTVQSVARGSRPGSARSARSRPCSAVTRSSTSTANKAAKNAAFDQRFSNALAAAMWETKRFSTKKGRSK
eukprot:TRINITY_DN26762_c0_g1_i1.p1 TRINITY_DN26762_c0_g1~~TRINITY_DN26762_c0_g1_i1.p1  ORF type:complete len:246 (-),score=42.69 TRINITY_DN26762_c0_g1_i1:279-1016(-)